MSDTALRIIRRRPDVAIPALLLGVALLLRAYSFTVAGLDWDESLYIVMAQRWLQGGLPYVAVWDQHPVGVPAIFAAAQLIIGDGLLAARVAGLLAVVSTAILLTRFMARFVNEPLAGVFAGMFYLFYLARPDGLAANTEIFNNLAATAAAFLLFGEMLQPAGAVRERIVFAAALLFGVGLQLKYVIFPEAMLLCCALLLRTWGGGATLARTLRMAGIAAIGGLAPTAVVTLLFWRAGALQAYLDANIRANLSYVDEPFSVGITLLRLRYGLLPLAGLLPWPFALAWLRRNAAVRHRFDLLNAWLMLWLLAACIDVALPMKLWKHYFNAMIPPLCLIAGLAITLLSRRAAAWRGRVLALAVTATLLPAIGLMVKQASNSRTIGRVNVPLAIAEQIERGGTDGHDVYVFNYDPLVYAYADAAPPTRFVLGIELAEFSSSSGAPSTREIHSILAAKPRWIVVASPSPYVYPPGVWSDLAGTLAGYRLAAEYRESDYVQPLITVRLYRSAATSVVRR